MEQNSGIIHVSEAKISNSEDNHALDIQMQVKLE